MAYIDDMVSEVESHLEITISDKDKRWAYNEFASIVYRIMQSRYGEGTEYLATSVGTSGLTLSSSIANARNYNVGFEVWQGDDVTDLQTADSLERIHPGICSKAGYFILGGKLYLKNLNGTTGKPTSSTNVIILYKTKRTVLNADNDNSTYEFEFDQDLEPAFKRYLQAIFFDGKFRPENVASAQAQAQQWITMFASQSQTT